MKKITHILVALLTISSTAAFSHAREADTICTFNLEKKLD